MKKCVKCKADYNTHSWKNVYCSPWCERNFDKNHPPIMARVFNLKKKS